MTRVRRFWYLGTPYTKYALGIDEAFKMACGVTAMLLRHGVVVYSPIVHSHPVAMHATPPLDPLDHKIWLPANEAMMAAACGLIVYCAPGWDTSVGVRAEIDRFNDLLKPVYFLDSGNPTSWHIETWREMCAGKELL